MQIESNKLFDNLDIFFQKFSDKKRCGCYCKRISDIINAPARHHAALPLKHIDYQVEITNGLVSVTLEQRYVNPTDKFLEVEFSLPIDPNASIYKYIA